MPTTKQPLFPFKWYIGSVEHSAIEFDIGIQIDPKELSYNPNVLFNVFDTITKSKVSSEYKSVLRQNVSMNINY